jgi:hypothetical protein
VTASWLNNTITISGSPSVSGTFNYSIPLTGGCGTVSAVGTITVNDLANVTLSYGGPFCLAFNSVSPTNSWTGGGTYSAVPAGLDINTGTGLVALNTSAPGSYTITFTPNGCAAPANAPFVLNAAPVVNVVPTSIICSGTATNLTLTSSPVGATFNWTQVSVVATGASNGSGNTINQVLQVPGLVQGTVTYSITATLNGCSGPAAVSTVTVKPAPQALAAASIIPPCIGGGTQLLAENVPGATYSWTGPNNFISSLEDPTIANLVAASEGTYQLIVSLNGCSDTTTALLNINDPVVVTLNFPDSPYCLLETEGLPTNSWAGTGLYTVAPTGLAIDSNTGVIDPSASIVGNYTVTFTPVGCALPINTAVQIIQSITPTFNPIPLICYGVNVPSLLNTSINGISGNWNPSTISNTNSGTYTFTPNPNQCAVPTTLDVVVSPEVIVDGIYHD